MRTGICLVLTLLTTTVHATPLLLGGETSSMGGSGAASGRDAAMFLLNPAGLARMGSTWLSLSASVYGMARVAVPRFFNEGSTAQTDLGQVELEGVKLGSTSFVGYPSQASLVVGLGPEPGSPGHMIIGGCLVIPDHVSRFFEGTTRAVNLTASQSFEWSHKHSEMYFGPAFAIQIGRRLLLGASLLLLYYSFDNLVSGPFVLSDPKGTVYLSVDGKSVGQGTSLDFVPVVGGQLQLTDHLALGLAITAPALHLTGGFSGSGQWRSYGNNPQTNSVRLSTLEGETTANNPLKGTVGLSYRRERQFGVALDFTLLAPRERFHQLQTRDSLLTLRPGYEPEQVESSTTSAAGSQLAFQVNVGAEWYFKPSWVLRGGAFVDRPTIPDLDGPPGMDQLLDLHLTRLGGTLGLSAVEGLIETTLGVALIYGTGTTVGYNFAQPDPSKAFRETDARSIDLLIILSGGFDIGEIQRALGRRL